MMPRNFGCLDEGVHNGVQLVSVGTTAPENYRGPLWAWGMVGVLSTLGSIVWFLALLGPAVYWRDFGWMFSKIHSDLWSNMRQRVFEAEVF